jgi:hypothetical protein
VTNSPTAEDLLHGFGIVTPNQIDLEAIAFALGAEVKRAALSGHEARIVGTRDRAIIWVDCNKSYRRQRFSIAHEIAHWQLHRGELLFCSSSDIGSERAKDAERVANHYAANLLMPWYLFRPALTTIRQASWESVADLSSAFNVSRPAIAIRMVDSDRFPLVLTCHRKSGDRWFRRSPNLSDSWYVNDDLDPRAGAFEVLYGDLPSTRPRKVSASLWFTRSDASRFQVIEQSIRSEQEVYTLLTMTN